MEKRNNSIYPTFYKADDVAEILNISKATAYKVMQTINQRMEDDGYITISGRVNSDYFWKCMYVDENRSKGVNDYVC